MAKLRSRVCASLIAGDWRPRVGITPYMSLCSRYEFNFDLLLIYEGHDPSKPKSSISSSELNDWLAQRNKFSNNDTLARSGVMRVLFCKREHYKPIDFPLSKESYLNVESSFDLPKATFQSLCNNGGVVLCTHKLPVAKRAQLHK